MGSGELLGGDLGKLAHSLENMEALYHPPYLDALDRFDLAVPELYPLIINS